MSTRLTGQPLYRLRTKWTTGQFLWFSILSLVLSTITLGIYGVFAPYAFAKKFLDGIEVYDAEGNMLGILQINVSATDNTGSMIGWILLCSPLCVFTGLVFYPQKAIRDIINNTYIVQQSSEQRFVT